MGWPGKKHGRHATRVQRPMARSDELVVEEVGDEILVYDQRNDRAHCLSGAAARVWRASDGDTTVEQMSDALEIDLDVVRDALQELGGCDLLEAWQPAGVTRREATTKLAKVGAVAAAAPLIYSIAAPSPALATSQATCLNAGCSSNGCGPCKQAPLNCCCCGPGSGNQKFCTADCSAGNCASILASGSNPCNTVSSSNACNC